ncbi:M23 family peptidase [Lysobacter sp. TY2-98]|uniref:M23 family metallopeptidase n=1 Tax=Lysobacter sp. TY2-98 TaxID=2290922 RepID=UPI000E209843|nr:M23 family metallopeptidase [Lysobacter sp. TY2-98]AXK72755.1 M23 family peptidase [Lysobacter sp. TY2-98]
MLRYLLVFVIGALLGANVAWYYARPAVTPCPSTAAVASNGAVPVAATASPTTAASSAPSAAPVAAAPASPASTPVVTSSGLIIPVAGIQRSQLVDTYTQSRAAGRLHEAIDIMAPAGTPVLAAVDGPVAKLFTSKLGGLTIYQFDPDGRRVYYYAHLQSYAPGLVEGQALKQGQVIGYVGSTGDASPEAPHLHFSVGDLGPDKQWWKSTPTNPYPLLAQ